MTTGGPARIGRDFSRDRQRARTLRHTVVMLAIVGVLGILGLVAGGSALGNWSLPFVYEPSPGVRADPSIPVVSPTCGTNGTVEIAAPESTTLTVLNGGAPDGMGARVAAELEKRGFVVEEVSNAPADFPGAAEIRYAPERQAQAVTLAAHVEGVSLAGRTGTVAMTLVLGEGWARLNTAQTAADILAAEALPGCTSTPAAEQAPDPEASA